MRTLAPVAAAIALTIASTVFAEAGWSGSAHGTGPAGRGWTWTGSGGCRGRTCTSTGVYNGPFARWVRNSTFSCVGRTCTAVSRWSR